MPGQATAEWLLLSREAVAQSSEDEVRRPAWGLTYA
jgi:hypothetical protein